ncbi:Condensation multi-domain protein [Pyrenophora tritici-repentis]|nr:Condensation multi-domain protein [Pyrenophora tritici-repentis]
MPEQMQGYQKQLDYWVAELRSSRPAEFLCDKPRPATLSGKETLGAAVSQATTFESQFFESQTEEEGAAEGSQAGTAATTEASVDTEPDNGDNFDGINWDRLPRFMKPLTTGRRVKSWIFQHGYRVVELYDQNRVWFVCKYCHIHKVIDTGGSGVFDVSKATSSAAAHLGLQKRGHGFTKDGLKPRRTGQQLSLRQTLETGVAVSQEAANAMGNFNIQQFREVAVFCLLDNNLPMELLARPSFREMISLANPEAEAALWVSPRSVATYAMRLFQYMQPQIVCALSEAASKIHISFDGWTTKGGKRGFFGVVAHFANASGVIQDLPIALPHLAGSHTGDAIADTIKKTLQEYSIGSDKLGYFVLDNAANNDTAVSSLAHAYDFNAAHRRLRCGPHTLNLIGQAIIFGSNQEAYNNNNDEQLQTEEVYMQEWRQEGPLGVLIDVINHIKTPQQHEIFRSFQTAANAELPARERLHVLEPVKPVVTRWNSYYAAFKRATQLQAAYNSYAEHYINALSLEDRRACQRGNKLPEAPSWMRSTGLTAADWAVITEYQDCLEPLKLATEKLEGRGKAGKYGAIYETIPVFEYVLGALEARTRSYEQVDFNPPDAPEDHLFVNLRAAWSKANDYYNKLDRSPAYYAATCLHPYYKYYCENSWVDKPEWLTSANAGFLQLWQSYTDLLSVSRGGPKSWIYRHGWAVWHRKYKKNYWLCRYCHQRRKQEACYEADSTTNAGRHLSSNKPGHSHGPNGPVPIASREGNIMGALAKSQVHIMRSKGIEVSQEVANEMAASFSTSRFQDALKDWVVADNQSLRVIETPQFRAMIAAVSPLAEALLWRSHQTLHDHIITEYNTYIPAVANYLREARSLIHVSFDNWTSTGGQYAFTGLCVHYLNSEGKLVDHLLGLPELHGAHTGNNIAAAATTILRLFGVDNARVGYFVLDNASNNDTAVESLAEEFGFIASERRLRCCCHILNLSAQLVIWGKDRSAYENEAAHLEEEEKYMDEWRKYGPVGVLFDVIASICTPQTRQLLERLQCEEAESLGVTPHIRQLVKPVKTRWNSYFNTFVRAAELHGPIDGYIECKLEEHSAATATSRRRKNREQLPAAQPRLYIREGGLNGKDWATITEYIRLLEPFAEATRLLEGRGRHGRHGAIWEVLVTFEWLLDQLEALKDRLKDVNYEDLDAPEDHLITNVNLAHCKLAEYYAKFDNAPVYYTATILHPHYKHHLSALWKVPDTHVTARDGVHYRDGWLDNNHRAFLRMWQGRKDSAATSAHTVTPPRKKPRLGISTSRSAFLQSSIEQSTRQLEASLAEDEYEIWKRQPALAEEDWLSLNPLLYWESVAGQFPILSKFAIDVLTIPAAAADCERTFSELGDMLGTRRLHMKPELISALQSLKSWKRLGIQPTTTSASGLARTLSEEEISKQLWSYKPQRTRPLSQTTAKPRHRGIDDVIGALVRRNKAQVEAAHDDEYERWRTQEPEWTSEQYLSDGHPVKYWIQLRSKYPCLSQFAIDILTIPASSCDCERLFSELGDLLEPRRRALGSELLAALQLVRSWRRAGFDGLYNNGDDEDKWSDVKDEEIVQQAHEVTPFVVLLDAFRAAHYRLTGQDDATIGAPNANRDRWELRDMIGFFVNMQCIRIKVEEETSFRELVQQVYSTVVASLANQDVPFESIVSTLQRDRDISRNPLAQVAFAVHAQRDLGKFTLDGVETDVIELCQASRFGRIIMSY